MADDTQPVVPITLVAVERGFAMGRMIEPGTKFQFNPVGRDGGPRKLPKWARLESDPKPVPKPSAMGFDTKPKDAQAAVRRKAGQLTGTVPEPNDLA